MRADKEAQESSTAITIESREQEVVLLTRTDKFGNTRPVTMNEVQEPKRGRRKREKVRGLTIVIEKIYFAQYKVTQRGIGMSISQYYYLLAKERSSQNY